MSTWRDQIAEAITDFQSVIKLARSSISPEDIIVEFRDAPHRPPKSLLVGKMAIYGFWWNGAPSTVIAGLVPATHVFMAAPTRRGCPQRVRA
jgi:hypothetical protein